MTHLTEGDINDSFTSGLPSLTNDQRVIIVTFSQNGQKVTEGVEKEAYLQAGMTIMSLLVTFSLPKGPGTSLFVTFSPLRALMSLSDSF